MAVMGIWDLHLENRSPTVAHNSGARAVLAALEEHLAALDGLGAHIAAAHVDAAIQQLRRDLAQRGNGET